MNSNMEYRLKKGKVQVGTTSGTVCAGDDSRLDAVTDHVADSDPHTQYQKESEKDQAGGYAGLDGSSKLNGSQQTYGTSADTACQGNDSRLSDSRTPSGSAGGDLSGSYPNPTVPGLTAKLEHADVMRRVSLRI